MLEERKWRSILLVTACALGLTLGLGLSLLFYYHSLGSDPDRPRAAAPAPVYTDPLTGLESPVEAKGRAFLVSMDNNPDARPQSGLSQADLIYELPAEGGISRLLVLFHGQVPEKIGPVRSVRPYLVDIARSWDGVLVHCGWSDLAQSYLSQNVVDYLNELSEPKYFWRDVDRTAPHNLYTGEEELAAWVADHKKNRTQRLDWQNFLPAGRSLNGSGADWVQVEYPMAKNLYQYDGELRLYRRYADDEPFVDGETGRQLCPANILVMQVESKVLDGYGRLEIDMTAGGDMWLFSGGAVVKGTWAHKKPDQAISFLDSKGKMVSLARGQTFIQIIDQNMTLNYGSGEPPVTENITDPKPNPDAPALL